MRKIRRALIAGVVAILPVTAGLPSCTAVVDFSFTDAAAAGQDHELPRKGYLGVRLAPGTGPGVLIEAVIPGTAATDGGLREGDLLLAVDGRTISGVADVMTSVAAMTVRQNPAQIDSMLRDLAVALHDLLIEHKPPDEILHARPHLRSILTKLAPAGRIEGRSMPFWSQLATRNLPAYRAKGNASVLAIWGRNDFIATEADHPFIAEIVNKARPGKGTYVALDGADHGFRRTTSLEDSFTRWKSPGGEFNPQIITTLKEWMERAR